MAQRLSPFVAAALALHVGAWMFAHFDPPSRGAVGPQIAAAEVWIDAPDLSTPEPVRPEVTPSDPAVRAREAIARRESASVAMPQRRDEPELPPNAVAHDNDGSWSMPSITSKPIDLGLDRTAFARGLLPGTPISPAAAPPSDAPPPPQVSRTGGLREALAAHDRELGLSHGGPVVSAAHDAIATSLVPNESAATIEIHFDRAGRATGATVVDATGGDTQEWNEALRALLASLANRPVHVPEQSAGLAVRVRIEVALRLPSGTRGALRPAAGVGSIGVTGDLSDIGQHPRRVVSARIVDERLL